MANQLTADETDKLFNTPPTAHADFFSNTAANREQVTTIDTQFREMYDSAPSTRDAHTDKLFPIISLWNSDPASLISASTGRRPTVAAALLDAAGKNTLIKTAISIDGGKVVLTVIEIHALSSPPVAVGQGITLDIGSKLLPAGHVKCFSEEEVKHVALLLLGPNRHGISTAHTVKSLEDDLGEKLGLNSIGGGTPPTPRATPTPTAPPPVYRTMATQGRPTLTHTLTTPAPTSPPRHSQQTDDTFTPSAAVVARTLLLQRVERMHHEVILDRLCSEPMSVRQIMATLGDLEAEGILGAAFDPLVEAVLPTEKPTAHPTARDNQASDIAGAFVSTLFDEGNRNAHMCNRLTHAMSVLGGGNTVHQMLNLQAAARLPSDSTLRTLLARQLTSIFPRHSLDQALLGKLLTMDISMSEMRKLVNNISSSLGFSPGLGSRQDNDVGALTHLISEFFHQSTGDAVLWAWNQYCAINQGVTDSFGTRGFGIPRQQLLDAFSDFLHAVLIKTINSRDDIFTNMSQLLYTSYTGPGLRDTNVVNPAFAAALAALSKDNPDVGNPRRNRGKEGAGGLADVGPGAAGGEKKPPRNSEKSTPLHEVPKLFPSSVPNKERLCLWFVAHGKCTRGNACTFAHEYDATVTQADKETCQKVTREHLKTTKKTA